MKIRKGNNVRKSVGTKQPLKKLIYNDISVSCLNSNLTWERASLI